MKTAALFIGAKMTDLNFIVGCAASAVAGGALVFLGMADEFKKQIVKIHLQATLDGTRAREALQEVHHGLCDLDATVNALSVEIEETQRIARDGRQILAQLAGPAPVRFAKPVPPLDVGDVRHG